MLKKSIRKRNAKPLKGFSVTNSLQIILYLMHILSLTIFPKNVTQRKCLRLSVDAFEYLQNVIECIYLFEYKYLFIDEVVIKHIQYLIFLKIASIPRYQIYKIIECDKIKMSEIENLIQSTCLYSCQIFQYDQLAVQMTSEAQIKCLFSLIRTDLKCGCRAVS